LLADIGLRIRAFARGEGMRAQPQRPSDRGRINPQFFPPRGFICAAMNLAMMTTTQRNRELVADLLAERSALREAKMVSITRLPAADQTRMRGDKLDMIAVTNAPGLWQR
jgi:hypothetical protein